MCLRPSLQLPVPDDTAHVARLAFPHGNRLLSLRDKVGLSFDDARRLPLPPYPCADRQRTGEEAVIVKDARVTEEVVVRKDVEERVETVHDTVRRTEIEVDDTRVTDARGTATAPASSLGRVDPAPRR